VTKLKNIGGRVPRGKRRVKFISEGGTEVHMTINAAKPPSAETLAAIGKVADAARARMEKERHNG
jgi:hypothetical protein